MLEELEKTLATRIVSTSMEMIASYTDSPSSRNNSSSFDSGDEDLDSVSTLYKCILSQCYFAGRHHEKVDISRMDNDILRMNPNRFKTIIMMSSSTFDIIWNMIKDHNIFTNDNTSVQCDSRLQNLVVLFKFGAYKNGTSMTNVAASFHISTGVLSKFTKRVMVALLSLETSVICWPNATKNEAIIKLCIQECHSFPRSSA